MRRILLTVGVLLAGVCAAGAERLATPIACDGSARAGTYPIAGPHSRIKLSICATGAKHNCRSVVVHKFTVACGGKTLTWQHLAHQILRAHGIAAVVQHGRLAIKVPNSGLAELDPSCRADSAAAGCLGGSAAPAGWITLPAGYAPVLELGARVIGEAESTIARLNPISSARASELEKSAAMELPGEVPAAARRAGETGSQQAPASVATETPSDATPPTAGNKPPARTVIIVEQDPSVRVATAARSSAKPWTATVVEAVTSPISAERSVKQSMIATILGLALVTSLVSGIGWFATQQFIGARARRSDPYQVILRREVVDLAKPDAQMCGELCRTGQGLIGDIHGRISDIKGAAPLRRVLIREVRSMEQFLATTLREAPDDPREWRRMRLRLQRVVTDLIRLKDITDGARRSLTAKLITDELPRDKQEAYEVLGANPEASEKILKRLVDALRATWHPDLAVNDDDRALRDRRIKQINVAWDLIIDKRVEA